jgi:hypothetical protein
MSAVNWELKEPMGLNITDLILTERQIKAGLSMWKDEGWIFLCTKGGTRLYTFGMMTGKQHMQDMADDYLKRIDWQDA